MSDITEHQQAQPRTIQGHHFLQTVLDSLSYPFYIINVEDYTVEVANRAAYEGHLHGEFTCYALSHGRDRPCEPSDHPCPLQEILVTKEPVVVEHVHLDKDGRRRHVEVRGFPIADSAGNMVQMAEYSIDITERKQAEEALARQGVELQAALYSISEGVIATDAEGRVLRMNSVAEKLTGWTEIEAAGKRPQEIACLIDEETRDPVPDPVERVLHLGAVIRLADRSLLLTRDGGAIPVAGASAPIHDSQGNLSGVALVFHDQTEERLRQRFLEIRLSLIEYAVSHTLDELLSRALDEVGAFLKSPIGFYHFVDPDQTTLSLQQWSTRTLQEFCQAEGEGMHHAINQAGVWTDCVRQIQPVIHNDYASLPHRKGLPPGHAELIRELVVPVMREGKVVAILGVGNKPDEYTERDVEILSYLADVTWQIFQQKRAEEALRDSEAKLRALLEVLPIGISVLDRSRQIQLTNPALARILDLPQQQLRAGTYETRTYLRSDGTEMPAEEFPSIRAAQEQRTIHGEEIGVVKADGEEIWTAVSAAPLPFDDWNVIVATADITRLKRADMALQQAHDELEQRVAKRTDELQQLNRALQAEISERQRAEEELRSSDERFRQLADHINHAFWISDVTSRQPLYVSPAYEVLWDRTRQSLYEQPSSFIEAIHPEDRSRVEAALERASREEQVEQFRVIRSDSSLAWVRIRVFPVQDELGRVYRLAGIAQDVSEQVEAVRLLEDRVEERTRQISTLLQIARSMTLTLELSPLLELILDGLQTLAHYDGAIIYEVRGEELVAIAHRGMRWSATNRHSSIPLQESALAQKLIAEQGPLLLSNIEERVGDPLLEPVSDWASCGMAAPLGVRQQAVGLLLLYSRRPQSYSEQQAALLLALANQAAVGVENARLYEQAQELAALEERQRLARELHDAVSQTLFSANIIAEALPRIWERNPEGVQRRLPELHRLTSGALAEMRTLLLELRPTALADVELGELLEQATNAFSGRSRTRASLRLVGRRPLPVPVQLALYRIAQEGLNNVAKHARATEVQVRLKMEPDRVELRIRDDGRGFDPDTVPAGCMGLNILRERAKTIGADLEVTSQPGEGTQIVATWTEPD